MKFQIKVRSNDRGTEWTEDYERPEVTDQASAEKAAVQIIDFFNSTCQPGESHRTLLATALAAGKAVQNHKWEKTNSFTIIEKGGAMYDTMKCSRCGITGRRYNIRGGVLLDGEFRRIKAFKSCDTAIALMEKRERADKGGDE